MIAVQVLATAVLVGSYHAAFEIENTPSMVFIETLPRATCTWNDRRNRAIRSSFRSCGTSYVDRSPDSRPATLFLHARLKINVGSSASTIAPPTNRLATPWRGECGELGTMPSCTSRQAYGAAAERPYPSWRSTANRLRTAIWKGDLRALEDGSNCD